ncbi:hypothetical protein BGZ74_007890 [Mortierella antarctica]|nr:hypothetical protein BGZ74_007890 [Mortierella antarctica]
MVLATISLALFTTLPPCSAQSVPDPGPGPLTIAEYVFNSQKLFISDSSTLGANSILKQHELFDALDLSVSWPASCPAWAILERQPKKLALTNMALNKDRLTVFMFSDNKVLPYNVTKAEWGSVVNMTMRDIAMGPEAATDMNLGLVVAWQEIVMLGSFNDTPTDCISTDVLVFDVASSTWSKVTETPETISGDMLVFHGGNSTNGVYPSAVIFNFKDKVWVDA